MSWQLPVRSARLWGSFVSSCVAPFILYAFVPVGVTLAPSPAHAVKCIQGGYLPSEGAIECQRSVITESLWVGPAGCSASNCMQGPSPNKDQVEDNLWRWAKELYGCWRDTQIVQDYSPIGGWGSAGFDTAGNWPSARQFMRRYHTRSFLPMISPQTGEWVCSTNPGQEFDWGIYREDKASCPAGHGVYDVFYASEGGDDSFVCGDPARVINACPNPNLGQTNSNPQSFTSRVTHSRNTLSFGNPIELSTGAKMQAELVAMGSGGDLPDLVWHYNSRRAAFDGSHLSVGSTKNPLVSVDQTPWRHNFDTFVVGGDYNMQRAMRRVMRPSQARDAYFTQVNGVFVSTYGEGDQFRDVADRPGISAVYIGTDNTVDSFNATGRLVLRQTADGKSLSFTYTAIPDFEGAVEPLRSTVISQITTHTGRTLRFAYDTKGRVERVTDAMGQTITLSNPGLDARRLTQITHPDGKTRQFQYSDGNNPKLTGVVDENGQLHAQFGYDAKGRASSTEHAGGVNRFIATYDDAPTYLGRTMTVQTPAGGVARMTFKPLGPWGSSSTYSPPLEVMTGVSEPYPGCGGLGADSEVDGNGNLLSRTDFAGAKTCFAMDTARNLETKRVEGLATGTVCTGALTSPPAIARVVSNQWHPHWRLKTRQAQPKLIATWVYNGQPDPTAGNAIASCAPAGALVDGKPIAVLCKQVEQATTDATGAAGFAAVSSGAARVWTYTYNQWGQVLTAKSPRTDLNDTTTYAYYTDTTADHTIGDLKTVTDSTGLITQYTKYNKRGQPLEVIDPNGAKTTFTYTPRGWVKTQTVQDGAVVETTTHEYDGVGQLKKTLLPNGGFIAYTYDAAHRLTQVADNLGNRIAYTLDNLGNTTKEESKDPAGTLRRQIQRLYDAFDRLQSVTGEAQ
jgi:YD repeat-containing protein